MVTIGGEVTVSMLPLSEGHTLCGERLVPVSLPVPEQEFGQSVRLWKHTRDAQRFGGGRPE